MIGIKRARDIFKHHIPNSFEYYEPYTRIGVEFILK